MVTFVFAAILLCFAPELRADAGWVTTNAGKKYQSSDGTYATGKVKIKSNGVTNTYYFDSNGIMQTDSFITIKSSGKTYYFGTDGTMQYGWITRGDKKYYAKKTTGVIYMSKWLNDTYYFFSDGSMAVSTWVANKWVNKNGKYKGKTKTGWATLEGDTYYYRSATAYVTGWFKVDGSFYYANNKGIVQKSKWVGNCYVDANGVRVTGMQTIGSKTYIFDSNGVKYTAQWVLYNGNYYRVNNNGVVQKSKWVNSKYYVNANGVRVTGWQTIEGNRYYFSSKGVKSTGITKIDGIRYAFDSDGVLITSAWADDDYYAGSSGALVSGLQEIDGELYYFDSDNKKVTKELVKVGSYTYFFKATSGHAARNERVYYGTHFYYFDSNCRMVTNSWVDQYYYGSDGTQTKYRTQTGWWKSDNGGETYYYVNSQPVTGLQTIDGDKYYFNSSGVMQTGIVTIGSSKYYFGTDGKMVTSTTIVVGSVQYTINSSGVVTNETSVEASGGSTSSMGTQIANFAIQYVGNPYVYGGTSLTNGADCSGFVQTVFAHFGYTLLRTADEQMKGPSSSQISAGYTKGVSISVSLDALQPGDLLFYGTSSYASHVAIYIGDGQIVHASNSQPYPAGGIKISNWNYQTPVKAMRYWS